MTRKSTALFLRETQTGEIIDDVANGKSELGVLYLSEQNESVLLKLFKKNELVFEELLTASPHVFISKNHPLSKKESVTLEDLQPYPYLVYEQGEKNSFYFSEEFLSVLDFPKQIQVRDRATLFNLAIGVHGFTGQFGYFGFGIKRFGILFPSRCKWTALCELGT